MTARLFDNRLSEEWIGFRILKRICISVAVVHFSLAAASGYRAVVQIYSVSLETPKVVTGGTLMHARVSTAGRTYVDTGVEIIQGTTVERITAYQVPQNDSFFYDFRTKRAEFDVTVPPDIMSRFKPGPAKVRLIAEGRMQWVHVPPPKIDVVSVELR